MGIFEGSAGDGDAAERRKLHPALKLALELGPLAVFFLGNAYGEALSRAFPPLGALGGRLFVGTALFIPATLAALAVFFALTRRLPIMPFVSAVVVLVFGCLTLWFQNEEFIKVKPTIIYALFGTLLLGGLALNRPLIGYVFESAFRLDDAGWRKLTLRWGLFFFAMAVLNEFVWRNFSTDVWVSFKALGAIPLTVGFTLLQMPLISRHSLEDSSSPE